MAIIGLSGKIGSGKDTVGKIIQYLTMEDKRCKSINNQSIDTWLNNDEFRLGWLNSTDWQIKKFAYAVKQVCSILTGIPIKDFEKEEVKNRVLGEEWNTVAYFESTIDTDFGSITNKYDNIDHLLAEFCSGYDAESTEYFKQRFTDIMNTNNYAEIGSHDIKHIPSKSLTVRELLQQVGTDAMRNVIHPDVWVNALMSKYKPIDRRTIQDPDDSNISYPNWIITDVRFPNELKAIKDRDGIIIRVNRDFFGENNDIAIVDFEDGKPHESETALDDATFDYTIDNNGTIEELIEKVREILIKDKLI